LLIGGTNPAPVSNNVAGISLRAVNGEAQISVAGAAALYLNRKTNDGALAYFRKDGGTIGALATAGGDLVIGSHNTCLRFDDSADDILPTDDAGVVVNNTLSLGSASARFKDLYLSGGVKASGLTTFTGATPLEFNKAGTDVYTKTVLYDSQNNTANNIFSGLTLEMGRLTNSGSATPRTFTISDRGATNRWCFSQYGLSFNPTNSVATAAESLDDYEEGTWTPTSGINLTVNTTCRYIKIGKHLTVTFDITFASNSDGNSAAIGSIPFSYTTYNSGFTGWQNTGSGVQFHVAGTTAFVYNSISNAVFTYGAVSGKRLIGTITGIVA